jgi:phenylpropionate dioxygenase-like ring-hydroxylating dioxygenase large terminal subunit
MALDTSPTEDALHSSLAWSALPSLAYSDPGVFRLENDLIFKRSWQYAARLDQLAKPGDYVATHVAGVPVLVTRADDGGLHAFVNVCRHRLHPVMREGSGNARAIHCPYHAWSYRLDGTLRAAPRADEMDCALAAIGLRPMAVETWSEFVFVNADPQGSPLAESIGELAPLAEENGFTPSRYPFAKRVTYELDVNWKLWIENSLECYHCPVAHRQSYSSIYRVDRDSYQMLNFEHCVAQFTMLRDQPDAEENGPDYQFYYVWPVSFFAQSRFSASASIVLPLGVDRTRFIFDIYRDPSLPSEALEEWTRLQDQTFREDEQLVLAQQRNYDSGLIDRAYVMQQSESSVAMFQRRTAQALSGAGRDWMRDLTSNGA